MCGSVRERSPQTARPDQKSKIERNYFMRMKIIHCKLLHLTAFLEDQIPYYKQVDILLEKQGKITNGETKILFIGNANNCCFNRAINDQLKCSRLLACTDKFLIIGSSLVLFSVVL